MSERGSFTTEYIYCDECYNACLEVLSDFDDIEILSKDCHIISGFITGMYEGAEFNTMDSAICNIQGKMCDGHTLRIVVLSDTSGTKIFEFDNETQHPFFY